MENEKEKKIEDTIKINKKDFLKFSQSSNNKETNSKQTNDITIEMIDLNENEQNDEHIENDENIFLDGKLNFQKGPIFTNIVLADELNRGSPKSQSAFLEAMEEKNVSIDGESYKLPEPFFVIATQNLMDSSGTSSLPD